MTSKTFFEICEDFFNEKHPNIYRDEIEEINIKPMNICNNLVFYILQSLLYIESIFEVKKIRIV
jgi:hypothetical protein